MAVNNPFKITYADQAVGGDADDYQLHGPYAFEASFERLRVVFQVIVVATDYETLQTLSDVLEIAFRKRDQDLIIETDSIANPGSSVWTYTFGTNIFNTKCVVSKPGNSDSDRGGSRAYDVVVEGDLPADDGSPISGLQDIQWNVDFEAGRQQIVTVQGVYTATESPAQLASVNYAAANGADAEATTFLSALDASATFELVDEQFSPDRNDHICTFSRQYVQLLVNQTQAALDAGNIRDHSITFTELASHPGDSREGIFRLRKQLATYDCAIDIDQATNLQTVYRTQVKPHIKALFRTNFSPQIFATEESRESYDESSKRLSISLTFLWQKSGGGDIVKIQESLGFKETRSLDRTPLHNKDELAAIVNVGHGELLRIATRRVEVLGLETPKRRLGVSAVDGPAGPILGVESGPGVVDQGWNFINGGSNVEKTWVGDPDGQQIEMSILTETVVESFNLRPTRQAITGGGKPQRPIGSPVASFGGPQRTATTLGGG